MLKAKGLDMPRIANLQYDNCGENKNKYMFMYLSLLVELAHFDKINISFLVVNHTHCSIDQHFSCFKGRIRESNFIGSPPALMKLLGAEGSSFFRGKPSNVNK